MSESVTVTLPYPPSANRLWRNVGGKTLKSEPYREWIDSAAWIVKLACKKTYDGKGVRGPYGLTILVNPPDRRKRDIDNLAKPLSDALKAGGAIEDDHLCQELRMVLSPDVNGVELTVMSTTFRIPAAERSGCAGKRTKAKSFWT